jgi:hypothetical protein
MMRSITLLLAITLPLARCYTDFALGDARAPISEEKFATLMLDVDNLILSAFQRTAERLLFESRKICLEMDPGHSLLGPMMDEARRVAITCYMARTTFLMRDESQFQEERNRLKREATHSDGPPDDQQPCWTVCGQGWEALWTTMMTEDSFSSASPVLPTGANFLTTLALSTVLGTRTRVLIPLLITAWSNQAGAWTLTLYTSTEGPQTSYGPPRDNLDRLTAYFISIWQDVLAYLDEPTDKQEL